ncbi:hypothetical protein [Allocoleopsis sp.]|uniref:hypothetical protein n=1 Tax=Allocoleopsis sp. TaxID=3088169 RepID=UPI002FD55810
MRLPRIGLTFLALLTAFVETPKSLNWITPLGVPQALAQTPVNWQVETNPLVPQGIKRTQISQLPSASPPETKVSQCNQIIEIANEAVSNAKTITNNGNSSEPAAMLRAAEAMGDAAEKMKRVSLNDPILQGLQSRFIVMYEQTSQATRDFIRAFQAKNRPEAEAALHALETAISPEKQLVDEINNYCGGNSRNALCKPTVGTRKSPD